MLWGVESERDGGHILVEQATPIDMMELASDMGPASSQVGAVLVLDSPARLTVAAVRRALADRIRTVPRLRQRLVGTPPGCGRPVWIDDPGWDIALHVHASCCPAPGDEAALLAVAAEVVTRPLPADRPLWSATLVNGVASGRCALVLVFHHVLADGMGGLAVLARLVDGAASTARHPFPRPRPPWRLLAREVWAGRVRALGGLGRVPARLREAGAELRPGATRPAPRCSLNRPVGARRRFGVTRADLGRVRAVGHRHGGTVNDVVLAAVGGALRTLLHRRGEDADHVVASIPVSGRSEATVARLGNQVGVIPVEVPTTGTAVARLEAIAPATRARKTSSRAASATVLAPVFRTLAALGVLRWLVERQPLVTTFVTNLRGPEAPVTFLGATVSQIVPLNALNGNVAVAFAVLSYAGTLVTTVAADTDAFPDLDVLVDALQHELDTLTAAAGP